MELALYAPGLGYYAAGARKFGTEGDFVTAPEISPDVREVPRACRPSRCSTRSAATSSSWDPARARSPPICSASSRRWALPPERYLLLEVSPDLRERQRAQLAERFPDDFARFVWLDRAARSGSAAS